MVNTLQGVEKGNLFNVAVQLAVRNTLPDCPVTKDILLGCLEIACEFKRESENVFDEYFPIIKEEKQEPKNKNKINIEL